MSTGAALPNATAIQYPRLIMAARRTLETVAPAVCCDRFQTSCLRAEAGLPSQKIYRFLFHE